MYPFVSLRWPPVCAIAIVPFLLLSFVAPFAYSGPVERIPTWHPHYRRPSDLEIVTVAATFTRATAQAESVKSTSANVPPPSDEPTATLAADPGPGQPGYIDMAHMYTLCDGHDNLPTWLLRQCDPTALAMAKDFIAHEALVGTDRENVLDAKMTKLQTTYWRDGEPIGLWSDNVSELKHFMTSDPVRRRHARFKLNQQRSVCTRCLACIDEPISFVSMCMLQVIGPATYYHNQPRNVRTATFTTLAIAGLRHYSPAELLKIMKGWIMDAPTHLRLYLPQER